MIGLYRALGHSPVAAVVVVGRRASDEGVVAGQGRWKAKDDQRERRPGQWIDEQPREEEERWRGRKGWRIFPAAVAVVGIGSWFGKVVLWWEFPSEEGGRRDRRLVERCSSHRLESVLSPPQ